MPALAIYKDVIRNNANHVRYATMCHKLILNETICHIERRCLLFVRPTPLKMTVSTSTLWGVVADSHPTLTSAPSAAAQPGWASTETTVSVFFGSVASFANSGCSRGREMNKRRRGRENSCSSRAQGHKSPSRWQTVPAGQSSQQLSVPLVTR